MAIGRTNERGEAVKVAWYEQWNSVDVEQSPAVIRLCESQQRRLQLEFAQLQTALGNPEWT